MQSHIDHLVVAARTLAQGVQWCEDRFGITPGPGGQHALFGTHNRLFKVATPGFPWAYLEIIAIDPLAAAPPGPRWFDLDDARLQAAVAQEPRLVHWVANTPDIHKARTELAGLQLDRGPVLAASRESARGRLDWQITVRDDGQRLLDGTLPTLIQWGRPGDDDPLRLHPRNTLPRSRVSLRGLVLTHPLADRLQAALDALGLQGVTVQAGAPDLTAVLRTPKGEVTLRSGGC